MRKYDVEEEEFELSPLATAAVVVEEINADEPDVRLVEALIPDASTKVLFDSDAAAITTCG